VHYSSELPPRTRRIRLARGWRPHNHGTTSAYAENTLNLPGRLEITGNYLRVRGEYGGCRLGQMWSWELPPRTRRIPIFGDKRSFYGGTTSAYAENT